MSFACGRTPDAFPIPFAAVSRFHGWVLLFLVLFAGFASLPAVAQQRIPLTLAEAEDIALVEEPGQAGLLARAEAFRDEAVAAGELPDPTLRVGLANYPLQSGGFTSEPMTQAQLGFRQSFPPGKTRAAGARQFESMALEMRQSADGRGRDVLNAVRQDWLQSYYWQHARQIVERSRPFFADLVAVTRSMYTVGRSDQQELLRAELELSRIDDRLLDIGRSRAAATADLSQWLGKDANRPIADKLPDWGQVPPLADLETSLDTHPMLTAADARIAASEAGVELAEERYKPGWALDLGYGYREGMNLDGSSRSDFVSLSITMDLPTFRKNRQDRKLAVALGQRRAANESREEIRRRLAARLESEYSRWVELGRRIDLYERQILALSGNHAQAALVAYQSDAADFADVMRAYIDDLNTRLEHTRLQVERAEAYATLANLGGLPR